MSLKQSNMDPVSSLYTLSQCQLFVPTEKNTDKRVESIKTILTYIKDNYKEKICISDLAKQINLNEQYFCRFFKKAIGRSPMEYVNEYRIRQARRLLEETDLPVTEVCLECGCSHLGNQPVVTSLNLPPSAWGLLSLL